MLTNCKLVRWIFNHWLNELVGLCRCMLHMFTNNERNVSCQVKRHIRKPKNIGSGFDQNKVDSWTLSRTSCNGRVYAREKWDGCYGKDRERGQQFYILQIKTKETYIVANDTFYTIYSHAAWKLFKEYEVIFCLNF